MTQSANWNGSSFGTAFSYANDFLGNRVSRGSSTVQSSGYTLYTWDHVNRLVKTVSASNGATFTYRPDGLRADKIKSHVLSWNVTGEDSGYYDEDEDTNQPTTRYFYDGQMTVEEDYLESVIGDVMYYLTQYALGARGIDGIRKYDEINEESWLYPVYDGHGNQIATLSRTVDSFALDNERLYDAWGVVKTGSATGGPTNRYCANLGHQQDDESGLIYMRARYYEPWTGRFVNQDLARDGWNHFSYCDGDPVNLVDRTGFSAENDADSWMQVYTKRYGEFRLALEHPAIKILAGGAAAIRVLEDMARKCDVLSSASLALLAPAGGLSGVMPWLPGLLYSLGSVARIAAGGMRLAAAVLVTTTMIAFLLALSAEAH